MRKTVINCDHCGKELNEMIDYVDIEIDALFYFHKADLCEQCYDNLNKIISEYINKPIGD